jgi:hypothetical protein
MCCENIFPGKQEDVKKKRETISIWSINGDVYIKRS